MEELIRRPIPKLKVKKNRKGFHFVVERNFTHGTDDFYRVYQNEVVPLEVLFDDDSPELTVALYANMGGEWKDYLFQYLGQNRYRLDFKCTEVGAFQFKIRYSLNSGNTWYWDNIPHSNVMVDPMRMQDIRMYTIIPTVSGHIGNWIDELYRIKKMGFNAVHLLPVTELDASQSPYSAFDLFDLDTSYSIPHDERPLLDQFEDFVKEAKQLDIMLCMDIVLNHVGITSQISVFSPDWIASDSSEKDGLKRAGCWDNLNWVSWNDLALIKYDHPNKTIRREIWDYMCDYCLFWAHYANYTHGMIRFDNLHSCNREFLQFVISQVRKYYPNLVIFAELFVDHQTARKMTFHHELNLLLATPWVHPYADQIRGYLSYIHDAGKRLHYLLPVTSHDSGSPNQEYGSPESIIPRYAAYALLGTGHTGIVQGSEYGALKKIKFIGRMERLQMGPDTWGYDYTDQITQINKFLDEHPYLTRQGNIQFVDNNHGAILAAIRYDQMRNQFLLVILNFDTHSTHSLRINFSQTGIHSESIEVFNSNAGKTAILDGQIQHIRGDEYEFFLGPSSVRIYEVRPVKF